VPLYGYLLGEFGSGISIFNFGSLLYKNKKPRKSGVYNTG
jgi:hypothetical protein